MKNHITSTRAVLLLLLVLYLSVLTLLSISSVDVVEYSMLYMALSGVYVGLMLLVSDSDCSPFYALPSWWRYVLLFAVSITLRIPFVFASSPLSFDSFWYYDFVNLVNTGQVAPDRIINPYGPVVLPLLQFVYLIAPTRPEFVLTMRVLMSLIDSLVPCLILLFLQHHNHTRSLIGGLGYAMFPLSLVESGWNGHFEALVTVLVLLSLGLYLKQHANLSGLTLAFGVALKFYSALLLLPLLGFRSSRSQAARLAVIFSVSVFILFLLPIPNGLTRTLSASGGGIASSSVFMANSLSAFAQQFAGRLLILLLIASAALVVLTALFVQQLRGYRVMLPAFALVLLYGILMIIYPFLSEASLSQPWWKPAGLYVSQGLLLVAVSLVGIFLVRHLGSEDQISDGCILGVAIVVLFVLLLPVLNGWYMLWLMPLPLLLKNKKLTLVLLFIVLIMGNAYLETDFAEAYANEPSIIYSEEFGDTPASFRLTANISSSLYSCEVEEGFLNVTVQRSGSGTSHIRLGFAVGALVEDTEKRACLILRVMTSLRPYFWTRQALGFYANVTPDGGTAYEVPLGMLNPSDVRFQVYRILLPQNQSFSRLNVSALSLDLLLSASPSLTTYTLLVDSATIAYYGDILPTEYVMIVLLCIGPIAVVLVHLAYQKRRDCRLQMLSRGIASEMVEPSQSKS